MIQSFSYFVTLFQKDFSYYCSQKLQQIGLTQGLLFFILYIGRHPECSPRQMSKALHMDPGHAARSLAKLIQMGFIRQTDNPKDRRAHMLSLTEKGASAFQLSHDLFYQWDEEYLKCLSSDEKEQLFRLLSSLASGLEEIRPCTK